MEEWRSSPRREAGRKRWSRRTRCARTSSWSTSASAPRANRRELRRGGGHYIIGEKLRSGSAEATAALSRQGRYQHVRDNLQVKEVKIAESERFVICFNPEQAERDAALREVMTGKLTALIADTGRLTVTKPAELRGRISTMPGLNRFLRRTASARTCKNCTSAPSKAPPAPSGSAPSSPPPNAPSSTSSVSTHPRRSSNSGHHQQRPDQHEHRSLDTRLSGRPQAFRRSNPRFRVQHQRQLRNLGAAGPGCGSTNCGAQLAQRCRALEWLGVEHAIVLCAGLWAAAGLATLAAARPLLDRAERAG